MATTTPNLEELISHEYRHGFVTDLQTDTLLRGLNEDLIAFPRALLRRVSVGATMNSRKTPARSFAAIHTSASHQFATHRCPSDTSALTGRGMYEALPRRSVFGRKR